jgi:hypothetical protein
MIMTLADHRNWLQSPLEVARELHCTPNIKLALYVDFFLDCLVLRAHNRVTDLHIANYITRLELEDNLIDGHEFLRRAEKLIQSLKYTVHEDNPMRIVPVVPDYRVLSNGMVLKYDPYRDEMVNEMGGYLGGNDFWAEIYKKNAEENAKREAQCQEDQAPASPEHPCKIKADTPEEQNRIWELLKESAQG